MPRNQSEAAYRPQLLAFATACEEAIKLAGRDGRMRVLAAWEAVPVDIRLSIRKLARSNTSEKERYAVYVKHIRENYGS